MSQPPRKPPTYAAYEVYCDDKLVGHVLGPPDGKGVAVPPWMISSPGNYEVRPAGPDVKLANMSSEPMRFEMRPTETEIDPAIAKRLESEMIEVGRALDEVFRRYNTLAETVRNLQPGWNPEHPVWKDGKVMGSDGEFHLSECMLVEHPATDYSCTCRDYEP